MHRARYIDLTVGVFMLAGLLALVVLAFRMTGLTMSFQLGTDYTVAADFSEIGSLRVHSPVTISGVKIGEVSSIELVPGSLHAKVMMRLSGDKPVPYDDVSARILTQGLLGSNYISITPGFDDASAKDHPYLKNGDLIHKTQSAMVLENIVGELLFNINK
ncbi:MAG: outer membrane lipid asymmetry maintenance protein MlaD [Legionellaceae bacterium]|nr:outer membrane lipid asymmetry maintenance protein MlaD [Legionellaceae bacterium]